MRHDECELSAPAVESGMITGGGVLPFARCIWHEANFVVPVVIVESVHSHSAVLEGEGGLQLDVEERVSGGRSLKRNLKDVVLVDGAVDSLGDCFLGGECCQCARRGELQHVTSVHDGESLASRSCDCVGMRVHRRKRAA